MYIINSTTVTNNRTCVSRAEMSRSRRRRVDNKLLPKLHFAGVSSICMKLLVSDQCAHNLTAHCFYLILLDDPTTIHYYSYHDYFRMSVTIYCLFGIFPAFNAV